MKWKDYPGDRLIAEHTSGFYVIKPKEMLECRPVFCPICESIMRSLMDDEAYDKFCCCDSCAIHWAYPNKDKWKEGWRPTHNDVMNKYKDRDT